MAYGAITNYRWDMGDGTIYDGAGYSSVSHAYNSGGTYVVTLTITNAGGETATNTYLYRYGGLGLRVVDWDFGDGQTGSGTPVTIVYPAGGSKIVTLDIVNYYGTSDRQQIVYGYDTVFPVIGYSGGGVSGASIPLPVFIKINGRFVDAIGNIYDPTILELSYYVIGTQRIMIYMPGKYELADGSYVRVYDWNYSLDGLHASTTDDCLRYALKRSQGRGWSEWGGDGWVYPEARAGVVRVYDDDDKPFQLVFDAYTGLPYRLGDPSAWEDGIDDYGDGTPIASEIRFPEDRGEVEHFLLESIEQHTFLRPFDEDNRGQTGYSETGYRNGSEFEIGLLVDGEQTTEAAVARDIPINGDIVHDRRVEGNRIQPVFRSTAAEWRLVKRRSYYVAKDRAGTPSQRNVSEKDYQMNLADVSFWISRGSNQLLNRATGSNCSGNISSEVTGPDGKSSSAMNFGGAAGDTVWTTLSSGFAGNFSLLGWVANTASVTLVNVGSGALTLTANTATVQLYDGDTTHDPAVSWDGVAWAMVAAVRDGLFWRIYFNRNLVGTFPVATLRTYSGRFEVVGGSTVVNVFDVRAIANALATEELQYYYDDIVNNNGKSTCPRW